MSKNVLIISSSLRANSNSEILAQRFADGAVDSGNNVEIISLKDKNIAFCKGCLACQKLHKCVINDDAGEIAEKMKSADVICYATPVYYYSVSGQLKTLFDRANCLYDSDYKFTDIYLLSTAAEDADYTFDGVQKAVEGWIDCYERAHLCAAVYCGGVDNGGEIKGNSALEKAYEMGKNV